MSDINHEISNTEVIPYVEGMHPNRLFGDHPEARFAVGQIGVGTVVFPGYQPLHTAYGRLRKNVYVDQTRMLDLSVTRKDGTEWDKDDARSDHLCVVERKLVTDLDNFPEGGIMDDEGFALRLVGAMRLIKKNQATPEPLPVEDFFAESFRSLKNRGRTLSVRGHARLGSCEVSRYIARHEDKRTNFAIGSQVIAAGVEHVARNGYGPTYAVVEPALEAQFRMIRGMPFERIAEPKYVEEYGAANVGLKIDSKTMAIWQGIRPEEKHPLWHQIQPFTYWGTVEQTAPPYTEAVA